MYKLRLNRQNALYKNRKGFTLVELIVVLVIIAILAALAVPLMLGFIDDMHKKQVISRGQTALTSTQAALSDIYTSNDNEYTPEKRQQTRLNAGSTLDDGTKFTVWNARPLYDERDNEREATVAITDEIGSYTVARAIYKDDDSNFAVYDGTAWEVYDNENAARAAISVSDSDENVIFVWPYDEYSDTARQPSGPLKPDPDDPGPDEPAAAVQKTVTLKEAEKGRAFFKKPESEDEKVPEIKITFLKDDLDIVISDWSWNDSGSISFTKDLSKLVLSFAKTYIFKCWQEEGTDYTAEKINTIQDYIFNEDNTGRSDFTFVACVQRDPNAKERATLGNSLFNSFLNKKTVENMIQVIDEDNEEDYFKNTLKATRVDDGTNYPYVIYAWMEGTTLKWWTNALVAFLPQDCNELCGGDNKGNVRYISFEGFDAAKVTSAVGMFKKSGIRSVKFGEFVAPKLTDMSECFMNCGSLATLDLSGIQEVGPTMKLTSICREMGSLTTASFGPAFKKTKIVGSLECMFNQDKNLVSVDVSDWDVTGVTSLAYAFVTSKPGESAQYVQNKIESINFGNNGWNLESCETLLYAFYGCGKNREHAEAKVDFSKIRTSSNLKNIAEAFKFVPYTELNVSNINVENVTNMRSTFSNCGNLVSLDISTWRPQHIRNLMETFRNCKKLERVDLSNWNLSELELMFRTFQDCEKVQVITTGLNTEGRRPTGGKLRSVAYAFYGCKAMKGTIDFSGWDTVNLKGGYELNNEGEYTTTTWYDISGDIENMFTGCNNLEGLILKGWDLSNAKQLNSILSGCNSLVVLDLSGWTVKQVNGSVNALFGAGKNKLEKMLYKGAHIDAVINMEGMLKDAKKLTIADFTGFEAPYATGAREMFCNCCLLNDDLRISGMKLNSVTSMTSMFSGCSVLENVNMSGCEFGSLTSINGMFNGCSALKTVKLSGTNFANVTDMSKAFNGCKLLKSIDLSGCQFNSLTDMNNAFNGCAALETIDLSGMNTQKVTNMASLFNGCALLKEIDVSGMKTPEVTDMSYMFNNCNALEKLDASGFNTANVTVMNHMFNNCYALAKLDVSGFNTAKVTDMSNMFNNCYALAKLDVSGFNTANVTAMNNMFNNCNVLTKLDVSGFNTANVTVMNHMFNNCYALETLDVSGFNTANVTAMNSMFNSCNVLKTLDVSGFNTANVTAMNYMFNNCYVLADLDVSGFNTANVTNMENMFNNCKAVKELRLAGWNMEKVTKISNMTANMTSLENIDISGWKLTGVVLPNGFLSGSKNSLKTVSMNKVNFGSKSDMNSMFKDFAKLEKIDMSECQMPDVTTIASMYYGCKLLKSVDVSGCIFNSLTDMNNAFNSCSVLEVIDLSGINTAKVTKMNSMFKNCKALKDVKMEGWDTSSVTTMEQMFLGCSALQSIDISGFDVTSLNSCKSMFYNCSAIEKIYAGEKTDFTTATDSSEMFKGDNKLVGGKGTIYNSNHINNEYAHIDGGKENPGYFTAK